MMDAGRRLLFAVAASALAATASSAPAASEHTHDSNGAAPAAEGFEKEMEECMNRMMDAMHSGGFSGSADADFLAMMIPHHVGAIDMARLVLQHGRDPATRQLAEEIIAGQTVEIESMTRRLKVLRQSAQTEQPEFPALGGLRGP